MQARELVRSACSQGQHLAEAPEELRHLVLESAVGQRTAAQRSAASRRRAEVHRVESVRMCCLSVRSCLQALGSSASRVPHGGSRPVLAQGLGQGKCSQVTKLAEHGEAFRNGGVEVVVAQIPVRSTRQSQQGSGAQWIHHPILAAQGLLCSWSGSQDEAATMPPSSMRQPSGPKEREKHGGPARSEGRTCGRGPAWYASCSQCSLRSRGGVVVGFLTRP